MHVRRVTKEADVYPEEEVGAKRVQCSPALEEGTLLRPHHVELLGMPRTFPFFVELKVRWPHVRKLADEELVQGE